MQNKQIVLIIIMISDLILGSVALYFYLQFRQLSKYWSLFFFFMALAAFVGAAFHGYPAMGQQYRFLSWTILSASLIFALLATYDSVKNKSLKIFFVVKSVFLLALAILFSNFNFMIIDVAISMLGFIVIGGYLLEKRQSFKISIGILVSILAAIIVVLKIDAHPYYLEANDIGHYISAISLIFISKGVADDAVKYMAIA